MYDRDGMLRVVYGVHNNTNILFPQIHDYRLKFRTEFHAVALSHQTLDTLSGRLACTYTHRVISKMLIIFLHTKRAGKQFLLSEFLRLALLRHFQLTGPVRGEGSAQAVASRVRSV